MKSQKRFPDNLPDLQAGIIRLKHRNFAFDLIEGLGLKIDESRILFVITGDNGTGKTTFLELVIIPWLLKNNITFTCKGQDIQIQSIVERSLNAILGITLSRKKLLAQVLFNTGTDEEPELPRQVWQPQGLLLDETDKLFSTKELKSIVSQANIRFVMMITHQLDKQEIRDIFNDFDQIINLNIQSHDEIRRVELSRW